MVGATASGMRRGILLIVGALFVAACSGTSAEPTTTTVPSTTVTTTSPPPTTTTTTTTTTVAPTTTTVDPLARPEVLVSNVNRNSIEDFDTTGDDLYRVTLEILDLFNYYEGNPTDDAVGMVSNLFETDYPYWNPILTNFLELTDNPGWHYVDPGFQPLGIEVLSVSGDVAVVRYADTRGNQLIAREDGSIVRTYEGWPPSISDVTLIRSTDGQWRFGDTDPSTDATDQDLATLVPIEWQGRTQ